MSTFASENLAGRMLALLAAGALAACSGTEAARDGSTSGGEAGSRASSVQLDAGTSLQLTLNERLDTNKSVGEAFTASVSQPVMRGGQVLVPKGAMVHGKVTAVQQPDGDRPAAIKMQFERIELRGESSRIDATLTDVSVKTEKEMKGEAKKIGGGAAAGALLGAVIGGGAKEAVMGAAAGAAAGTAVTLGTREGRGYLPEGAPMTIQLNSALSVPAR